jgi:4'-phosphopantetheinyl transferase
MGKIADRTIRARSSAICCSAWDVPVYIHRGSVIVVIAVVSDATTARTLIARWASDQDRADTMPGHRAASSLLARAALRALLAQHTSLADWRIVRNRLGKPFVVAPSGGALGPAVSLSHTGGTVAVAMAQAGALGIDIEGHRPRDFPALAAQAFGPVEQEEVAMSGGDGFYRIWTLREAMAKATGEGLALAVNGRDLVEGGVSGSVQRTQRGGRVWHLAHVQIAPDCSVAVAHAGAAEWPWVLRWSDLGTTDVGGSLGIGAAATAAPIGDHRGY